MTTNNSNKTFIAQKYSSAKTSVNSKRLPAIYNKIWWSNFRWSCP